MKKTNIIAALAIIATLFSFNSANAQSSKYDEVKSYLISLGYTICEDVYCSLDQGSTCYQYHQCYAGNSYIAIAFTSDRDVKDVDLYAYGESGGILDKDADTDQSAVVSFSPGYSQNVKFVFKNYNSATPSYSSRVYLLVAYR